MPGKRSLTALAQQHAAERTMAALAPRFQGAFAGASIHAGEVGEQRARAHGSVAVAEGRDIFLGRTVDPESTHGTRIIAHEMTHVVQQAGAARGDVPRGDALEAEAHQVGDVIAAGGSATPTLRTGGAVAQGYDSFEHKSMGDDVHAILDPLANGAAPAQFGGLSRSQIESQQLAEWEGEGASQAPGLSSVAQADPEGRAPVPRLAEMLRKDPFLRDGARSLSISLRNFKMDRDAAGPYLALEIDPATKQAARYDVPVSPGDMTALNGDLYGSMENMRKAPVAELVALQGILDDEARWERDVANGTKHRFPGPNFDAQWDKATAWRSHPVYAAGRQLGVEGDATGGDRAGFAGLALNNGAHFGEDTLASLRLEINVRKGNLDALAQGPQGNFADGNERAWIDGHASALVLAREAYALRTQPAARNVDHDNDAPATGLLHPLAPALPLGRDNKPLARSQRTPTFESKLNDAYVENAGADHYLTDAFAAGHQIVREVIGRATEAFVEDSGGQDKFLDLVVARLQDAALRDGHAAPGKLGRFQQASHGWTRSFARSGMKRELKQRIDAATLRSIGAKVVHDYYNRNGLTVHNQKGMTFVIMGDDSASLARQAREIIAVAVLESRNQITEMAHAGATGSPLDVWAYTPDLDKTAFTQASGPHVLKIMFGDANYLWELIKDDFSIGQPESTENERLTSQFNPAEQAIQFAGDPLGQPRGDSRVVADMGTAPMRTWLTRRQQYVQSLSRGGEAPQPGRARTIDGVTVPGGSPP